MLGGRFRGGCVRSWASFRNIGKVICSVQATQDRPSSVVMEQAREATRPFDNPPDVVLGYGIGVDQISSGTDPRESTRGPH